MAGRWAALAILLAMLAIVGIFLWAVIRPPAPVSSGSEGTAGPPVATEKRFAGPGGSWTLAAQAIPAAGREVAVTVWAKDVQGRPVTAPASPTALLRMLDMAMEPERVVLVQDGAGLWRGSTRVSMAGRWNLHVELNGESVSLPFEAGSR
jgi:hypothetical protein